MRTPALILALTLILPAQFRTTSTLVLAPTTVTAPDGKFIDGLSPEDLILYDNNVPQPLQVEEAFNPLSLVVAIQTSANAGPILEKLKDCGILFTHLVAGDRGQTQLVSFDDDTRVLSDFTTSPDRLAGQLRSIHVRGKGAATLVAVQEALRTLSKRPSVNRRVLLVIGESKDRSSKVHLEELVQDAQRQNVLIYWLAYSPFMGELTAPAAPAGAPRTTPPGSLLSVFTAINQQGKPDAATELTRVTGGRVLHFLKKDTLEDAVQAIGAEIHRQYVISFKPAAGAPAGQYHAIRIIVRNRPELIARTRAGYWTM